MRDIRELKGISAEFRLGNFAESKYADEQGHFRPEYLCTRDGFTLVAMGYNGEKAMKFKEAYIAAFNKMEKKLQAAPSIGDLIKSPQFLLSLVTEHVAVVEDNKRLQLTAAKYEGQTDAVGLYKIGDIAADFGISAIRLNGFLKDCRVQYMPNGSTTWRLYSQYSGDNLAFVKMLPLDNGFDKPMLLWTPKGRDFIHDLVEKEMPAWYA
jgi:Rha family phage regulatory protein